MMAHLIYIYLQIKHDKCAEARRFKAASQAPGTSPARQAKQGDPSRRLNPRDLQDLHQEYDALFLSYTAALKHLKKKEIASLTHSPLLRIVEVIRYQLCIYQSLYCFFTRSLSSNLASKSIRGNGEAPTPFYTVTE